MFICETFYRSATEAIRSHLRQASSNLFVVGILGNELSGKKTVCKNALDVESIAYESCKLAEISCSSIGDFLRSIHHDGCVLMEDYDDLSPLHRAALIDYVMSIKLGILENRFSRAIWLIPTRFPLSFADQTVDIPDLSSNVSARELVSSEMLNGFPTDSSCPISSVLFHSSSKLSIGNLSSLVRTAKLLALSEDSPALSCHHLSKSYHSLLLPCEPVDARALPEHHSCSIMFRPSLALSNFIGLSPESRTTITEYMQNPIGRVLIIAGPIASGKSHLAMSICSHPSISTMCVSSSDILTARIGDTEKNLHKMLSSHSRLVIEDIDQLIDPGTSSTGSVQRCLAVLVSFLDHQGPDRLIIGTSRTERDSMKKFPRISLSNKLSFTDKLNLIKSEFPEFNTNSHFDLIHLNNRAECILFGKDLKLARLREFVDSQ